MKQPTFTPTGRPARRKTIAIALISIFALVALAAGALFALAGPVAKQTFCDAGLHLGSDYPSKPSDAQLRADYVAQFGRVNHCSAMSYMYVDSNGQEQTAEWGPAVNN